MYNVYINVYDYTDKEDFVPDSEQNMTVMWHHPRLLATFALFATEKSLRSISGFRGHTTNLYKSRITKMAAWH